MPEQQPVVKIHCPACGQKMDVSDVSPFARISCPSCGGEVIVPRVFAGITLEEPISEGPRTAVYRALDPTLDREVIVKALPPGDPRGEAFLAEARRAAAITHANVAPIYSCGVEEGQAYVVMQFLAGGGLDKWLSNAEAGGNPRFALKCGLALARALSAARRQHLEHGHVVPTNVLLDIEGNVKLGDFGLARSLGSDEAWQPTEYAYASPETLLGNPDLIDWRSDLYSVGAIVHHLLTGHLPAVGVTPEQIRDARIAGQLPPDPVRLVAGLPPGLSDLVMSLLAYRPEDRPSGYEEVVGALRAFEQKAAHDSAGHTRTVKPTGNASGLKLKPLERAAPRTAPTPAQQPPQTRSQLLVNVGLIVAAGILMLLMVLFIWKQQPPEPTEPPKTTPNTTPEAGAPAEAEPGTPAAAPATPAPAAPQAAVPLGQRPRPAGLDFAGEMPAINAYLQTLPAPARALETERLAVIREIRTQLVKDMEYLTFKDVKDGIALANGRRLQGTLPLVNDNMLLVRTSTGDKTLRWADLAFSQYVRFLAYYLNQRITQADADLPADQLAAQQQGIGAICLRNAVLCEWYGQPQLGSEFAQLCQRHAKNLVPKLRHLAPGTLAKN